MAKPNFQSKTVWTGDNLPIMRGLNSESVDLIYLDPPFNSKADYAAPIGSPAEGAEFKDTWNLTDIDLAWLDLLENEHPALHNVIMAAMTNSDKSYLIYMAVRLLEMKRLLKGTGSIYLHCDPTMSHYLKVMLDAIFGRGNFRNELVWRIGWVSGYKTQKRGWIRNHDVILYYTMSDAAKDGFNKEYIPYPDDYVRRDGKRPTGQGIPIEDTWNCSDADRLDSIMIKSFSQEKTGYPTQKPLALLERIVKASSNEGDVVFDPFCGCATTLVAADYLQRNWIGIDISHKAVELVTERVQQHQGLFQDIISRKDVPKRTDVGRLPAYNCKENKELLYGKQHGHCNGCRTHFELRHLEVDHYIARADGGTDHLDNLQLLCGNCNRIKGKRGQEYLLHRLNARAGYLVHHQKP